MLRLAVSLLLVLSTKAFAQGTILFDTRIPGQVNARVLLPDGITGLGAGWTAQLFGGPAGTSLNELTPLFPTTRFKTSGVADMGFVEPLVVTVRGLPPGSTATVLMRTLHDSIPDCFWGESAPILVSLGGNGQPPGVLSGLQGFAFAGAPLCFIPEPSTFAIFVIGVVVVLAYGRNHRSMQNDS